MPRRSRPPASSTVSSADAREAGSRAERIARSLIERIRNGEIAPGTRLQSVRALARQSQVGVQTVLRAYDMLVAQGYLEARRGSGFYVARRTLATAPPPDWPQARSHAGDWRRLLRADLPFERMIGGGSLPEAWLDKPALASALRAAGTGLARSLSSYADPQGYLPLRRQLQLRLQERGIDAPHSRIVTSAGATDALHLLIWSHFRPGQTVLIEDPAPFMHLQRAMASGLNPLRVPRQADGPDLDALREACIRHKPLAFFCSSLLHNPTGTSFSPGKAYQVLRLAEEFDLLVVDDCTYADLLPSSPLARQVPLAALDQLQRVVHVGSLSKTLSPGLRCGFLAASESCVERVLLFKAAGAINTPVLGERIAYHLLSQGKYRHHCERLQMQLQERRQRLVAQLESLGFEPEPADAGLYLWLELGEGVDAADVADALETRGYAAAPACDLFTQSSRLRDRMRLNVAAACDSPALELIAQLAGRTPLSAAARRPRRRKP